MRRWRDRERSRRRGPGREQGFQEYLLYTGRADERSVIPRVAKHSLVAPLPRFHVLAGHFARANIARQGDSKTTQGATGSSAQAEV